MQYQLLAQHIFHTHVQFWQLALSKVTYTATPNSFATESEYSYSCTCSNSVLKVVCMEILKGGQKIDNELESI